MPKYEVTHPDGRVLELEGDRPPTEGDLVRIFGTIGAQKQPHPISAPSLLGRMNENLVKRGANISEEFTPIGEEGLGSTLMKSPGRAFRATGQVAGLANETIGELLSQLIPGGVKQAFSEVATETAQKPQYRPFVQGVSQAGAQFQQEHPEATKNIEAGANIAGLVAGTKGASKLKEAATPMIKRAIPTIDQLMTPSLPSVEKKITSTVTKGIEKAVRPSVTGNITASQAKQYFRNAQDAVENIVANKSNLQLTDEVGEVITGQVPKSLKQFREAIDQTKGSIFRQYDELAKSAGRGGAEVSLSPVAKEVSIVAENKVLQDLAPQVAEYAKARSASLVGKKYTTMDAQEAIKILNQSLDAFYKNPSYDTASKAYVDSIIVNNMRKSLDDVITRAAGPGYQNLKKSYGALKSIEKDVGRRATVDARKNVRGLIDFTDIMSGGAAVQGIISMNPAVIGQAATMSAIKNLIKRANDPNRIVKNMFVNTEKLMEKRRMIGGSNVPTQ